MKIVNRVIEFIRSKLSYKFSFTILLIIAVLGVFLYFSIDSVLKKVLFKQHEQKAISVASSLASQVVAPLLTQELSQLQLLLKNAQNGDHDIAYIYILDLNKHVPAHTFHGGFPLDLKKIHAPENQRSLTSLLIETEKGILLDVAAPVLKGSLGFIHIGLSRDNILHELKHIRQRFFLIFLLACIAAMLIADYFSRRITKPLETLVHGSKQIQGGNLNYRIPGKNSLDEIGVVTNSFNSMAASLEADTKKRIKAESALRESEGLYRSLVENIDMGITFLDNEHTILMTNSFQGKIFNKEPIDFCGRKCFQVFEKNDHICSHCPGEKALKTGLPQEKVTQVIRDDGSAFTANIKAFPVMGENQQYTGFIEVVEDVTDKLKMQEQLSKGKKLESIGVLAGGIAHDFNNILVAILGNINLALFDKNIQDSTAQFLTEAEKASHRAKDLTQQLLTFAKGGEPIKEVSSLGNIIKDSANFVLSGDKVICLFDMPDDLFLADVDKGQISQVIQNITLNASQAMPDGGTITIKCRNVSSVSDSHLSFSAEGSFVKIIIKDQGVGIPSNIVDKIFDPYFSTKSKGSGLGLAITHSIINKHGGHISVESTTDSGSTFIIYLPASREIIETDSKESSAVSASTNSLKIMIMDDEEMVRNVAQLMLVQLGHKVEVVCNGEEAIKLYQEAMTSNNKFDFVIMDLTIPGGMGGKDAVQGIIAIDPDAKVIVSSGYSNDPVMANFADYGFCAAIMKPFELQDLSSVIC